MSSPDPTRTRAALTAAAEQITAPGAVPGAVLGVDLDGARTVVAAGMASPELSTPMTRATVHDLASVTKVIGTTTALQRLVSAGLLDLDDAVVRVVPSFGGAADSTVRDLLTHRAGLWEWQPLYLAPGAHHAAPDGATGLPVVASHPLAAVDSLPPRYLPGAARHYSDLGFMTLGRIIERVSGSELEVAVRELVAEPLGTAQLGYRRVADPAATGGSANIDVATSSIGDSAEQRMVAMGEPYPMFWSEAVTRAATDFPWRTEPVRAAANDGNCFHVFGGVAGHAGLFGSVDDLLDVLAALSRADDSAVWTSRTNDAFFCAGPDPEQALGWRRTQLAVDGQPRPFLWHPGYTGAAVGFVPGSGIAVAFASNRLLARHPQATEFFWQRVLDALTTVIDTKEGARP